MTLPVEHSRYAKYSLEYLGQLASSCYQVFRLAIYSPIGSVELDRAVSIFLQQLRDFLSESPNVILEFPGDTVLVQRVALPGTHYFVQELCRLFNGLQIVGVEFDRSLNHRLLLSLAKNLLLWRKEKLEGRSQTMLRLNESGVQIIYETIDGPRLSENAIRQKRPDWTIRLNGLCAALSRKGMAKKSLRGFHRFLEERLRADHECKVAGFPYITWRDIMVILLKISAGQGAGRSVMQDAVTPFSNHDFDVVAISRIIDGLLFSTDDITDKEALWGFLEFLPGWMSREEEHSVVSPRVSGTEIRNGEQQQLGVVRQFVNRFRVPVRRLETMATTGNGEGLSVLLQILAENSEQKNEDNICALLTSMLGQPLGIQEWEVFICGMAEFAEKGKPVPFFRVFLIILQRLRVQKQRHSLECCIDIWRRLPVAKRGIIWPFMVNELLIAGAEERRDLYFLATEQIVSFDLRLSIDLLEELEKLDAFRAQKVAEVIFRAPFFDSYPFFALLLTTSLQKEILPKVLSELKKDPQDPVFAMVVPFLNSGQAEHVEFVRQYLLTSQQGVIPLRLRDSGGLIIVRGLMAMSDEEKGQPWVSEAIAVLAELWVDEAEELLHQIQQSKNVGVMFVWPRECRQAAQETCLKREEVLRAMKKRRLRGE